MKAPLEPEQEPVQVSHRRPRRANPVPTVQLLFEDLAANFSEIFNGFRLTPTLGNQVDGRIDSKIVKAQVAAGWLNVMKPLEEVSRW